MIGVTLNYRLGPLGFAVLPELKAEAGKTGNYGLHDQHTAIQWVKDNIASFGGDPDNMTIMGQSAGAMSVQQHCLSPKSKGLFHKAVMSSGGGVSKMMSAAAPEKNYEFWKEVMKRADCDSLEAFRKLDVAQLYAVFQKAKKEVKGGMMAISPVLDGDLVVGTGVAVLSAKAHMDIPYMAGSTSEDVMPPIIYTMGRD